MLNVDKLPKRKHPRLKSYDYSSEGAYFITICTQDRKCVFSTIDIVGRGLAPAVLKTGDNSRWFTPAVLKTDDNSPVKNQLIYCENVNLSYTIFGEIAKEQLLLLEKRYHTLTVDKFVIMPNHIHAIFILNNSAGASPRPTIMDIVCTYKSLTAKQCKSNGFSGKLFQTSFYDHILRNENDYNEIVKYIDENPASWFYDELYFEE